MPQSAAIAPIKTPRSSRSREDTRVLIALSEQERRLFFSEKSLQGHPGIEHADMRGAGRETWNRLLKKVQPTVLITGWSTPALDTAQLLYAGGSIDYVCHVAGSVRHIISLEHIEAGLKVTNWGMLIAPQVAEHALLTLLALMRNLGLWRDAMMAPPESLHRERLATRTLHGKTVAIHGFGMIARELIRLLRPFNVRVRAFSAGVPDSFIRQHQATPVSSLAQLAEHADVFVTCEALTPATTKSINAEVLSKLPEGAVFVNVGRGAVVDEAALIDAAKTRSLRVGSDVFTHEPLAHDSALFQLPGAILSPHIAGPAFDTFGDCGRQALANVDNYLAGKPLTGLITPEIFARST
ncbi:MAG: hydroxyacid dehydrogenase [Rariglobus sp.]